MEELELLFEELKNYLEENEIYDLDKLPSDLYGKFDFSPIAKVNYDEHRWYTTAINVYEIKNDEDTLYFGIREVISIKSESMGVEDCYVDLKCFKMKPVPSVTYIRDEN